MAATTIPLLREDELALTPGEPEFEALALQELGDAGTPDDGFDAVLLDAALAVQDGPAVLADLDSEIAPAENALPEITQDEEAALALELDAARTEGDSILSDFEGDLTPAAPPTPVTPTTSGGTGAGGGGGATGGPGGGPPERIEGDPLRCLRHEICDIVVDPVPLTYLDV